MRDFTTITDIHTHVLPALDDGPRDLNECEQLVLQMNRMGIHRAFSTSHYQSPHFEVTKLQLQEAYSLMKGHLGLLESAPDISLGAEVRIGKAIEEDILTGCIPTLGNTSYVLIEFPTVNLPQQAFDIIHELNVRGLRPVLAHPERYIAIQKDPKVIDELLSMDVYMQLTAWCFTTPIKESQANRVAWELLMAGKAHLIASDAHNVTTRSPILLEAYGAIRDRLGEHVVKQLIANANAVWNNEDCLDVEMEVNKPGLKRLLSFFSR